MQASTIRRLDNLFAEVPVLVMPPTEAFSRADIIPIRATTPATYSIRFRLYTQEEGESDLEVQATFIEKPATELMTVELDDILVA